MPGHLPNLDAQSLRRLRGLVESMHRHNGNGVPMRQLVDLARDVRMNGGVTIDFEATQQLGQPMVVVRVPAETRPSAKLDVLSPREREVAALIATGLSNKEIAGRLFISVSTVKDHVHNILGKTGLSNRAGVATAQCGDPA